VKIVQDVKRTLHVLDFLHVLPVHYSTVPVSEHRYHRRVQFADTDLAGVVHFSWIARYMEEAEHALWRAAGLSIVGPHHELGFPRVALTIDFKAPLRFEEEFEDHVRIDAISRRTIKYSHTITRGSTVIATGTMTAACVAHENGHMRAVEIPAEIRERFAAVS
jgi:YbgC/YbaW family acyl-CoA thioester hydrolase